MELRPRPGTAPDVAARELAGQDLAEAKRAGQSPLVLTGSAVLGRAGDAPALFVQLQSTRECGSAGCETSAYLPDAGGWRKVLDSVSGPVTVERTEHLGMRDLSVGRTRFVWNGTVYADTRPAPALHLRRR